MDDVVANHKQPPQFDDAALQLDAAAHTHTHKVSMHSSAHLYKCKHCEAEP